jgi:hypothetical protein
MAIEIVDFPMKKIFSHEIVDFPIENC